MTEDSPYTDALAELVETRWRRDALPNPICRCGCSVLAHRSGCSCVPGHRCPPCTFRARARLRLILICTPEVPRGSVALWDQRTSANDARAALSIACGAPPDDVHPVLGTWDRPPEPVQLSLLDAA